MGWKAGTWPLLWVTATQATPIRHHVALAAWPTGACNRMRLFKCVLSPPLTPPQAMGPLEVGAVSCSPWYPHALAQCLAYGKFSLHTHWTNWIESRIAPEEEEGQGHVFFEAFWGINITNDTSEESNSVFGIYQRHLGSFWNSNDWSPWGAPELDSLSLFYFLPVLLRYNWHTALV